MCREVFGDLEEFQVEFTASNGRFPEEENIEIYMVYKDLRKRLLVMKVFSGRPPHYKKWIEVFLINSNLVFGTKVFNFAGSIYEERLIECLSRALEGSERLFIDYMYDIETRKALELGVPPPLTRLGYILLQKGFTWFKDWYFPEGFMEGGPKLQAEKPVDERSRKIHVDEICREVREGINRVRSLTKIKEYSWIADNALKRVEYISKLCRNHLAI